jgi:DNA-binding response OmpR family regulator
MLDLIMPGMNGWEAYERIKEISNLHHVPITIYSSSDDPDDKAHALKMGAVDFIKKTSNAEELLAKLKTILEKHSALTK